MLASRCLVARLVALLLLLTYGQPLAANDAPTGEAIETFSSFEELFAANHDPLIYGNTASFVQAVRQGDPTFDRLYSEFLALECQPEACYDEPGEVEGGGGYLTKWQELLEHVAATYDPASDIHLYAANYLYTSATNLQISDYDALLRQRFQVAFAPVARRFGPTSRVTRLVRRRIRQFDIQFGITGEKRGLCTSYGVEESELAEPVTIPVLRSLLEQGGHRFDRQAQLLHARYEDQLLEWDSDEAWLDSSLELLSYLEPRIPIDSPAYLTILAQTATAVCQVDLDDAHLDAVIDATRASLTVMEADIAGSGERVERLEQTLAALREAQQQSLAIAQNDEPASSQGVYVFEEGAEAFRSEVLALRAARESLYGRARLQNLQDELRVLERANAAGQLRPINHGMAVRDLLVEMVTDLNYAETVAEARTALEHLGPMVGYEDIPARIRAVAAHALLEEGATEEASAMLEPVFGANLYTAYSDPEFLYPIAYNNTSVLLELQSHDLPQMHSLYSRILLSENARSQAAFESAQYAVRYLRGVRDNRPLGARFDAEIAREFQAPENISYGQSAEEQFANFVEAAWRLRGTNAGDSDALFADAFAAAQDALQEFSPQAVAQAAARELAARAGYSELVTELEATNNALSSLGLDEDSAEYRQLKARQSDLEFELQSVVPEYFRLIRPRALSLDEIRAAIGPDEAITLVLPTRYGTHVFVVTSETQSWHKSEYTEGEILSRNMALRADLDPWGSNIIDYWDGGFAAHEAHELFTAIVEPAMPVLGAIQTLYYVPSPALDNIPFSVFLMEPSASTDERMHDYRALQWLGDRFALTQLPSLSSLAFLRQSDNAASTARDFVAFADPVLEGRSATRGSAELGQISYVRAALVDADGDGASLVDPEGLRALTRLPGTVEEARAMASLFQDTDLYLDSLAQEWRVKDLDLADVRYLLFATHGLVAGEAGLSAEPGLVLTPPQEATLLDDGLLTASEILGLDLAARLVVLSACNTGAEDGLGGAGLSGLARSFFFAGADSLLVSHWPVLDEIAPILTVEMMRRIEGGSSRAQALRLAMQHVRNDVDLDAAHPYKWAPFVVVGDGR